MNILCLFKNISNIIFHIIYYSIGNFRASLLGVKLGYGARVSPKANINKAYYIGNATIGSSVVIEQGTYINSGHIMSGHIGKYCSIGYNVIIGPTEHDPSFITTSPTQAINLGYNKSDIEKIKDPPIIEDNVWIGANVLILKGTKIGKGSIIAGGAVVTKDVPSMEIWGGIPAKFIKNRIIIHQ